MYIFAVLLPLCAVWAQDSELSTLTGGRPVPLVAVGPIGSPLSAGAGTQVGGTGAQLGTGSLLGTPLGTAIGQQSISSPDCTTQTSQCTQLPMATLTSQLTSSIPGASAFLQLLQANNQIATYSHLKSFNSNTAGCTQKEDPSQALSFAAIQKLLAPGGIQSAIQQQCEQQFSAQKQQCKDLKQFMCALLPSSTSGVNSASSLGFLSPLQNALTNPCMKGLVLESISQQSGNQAGANACNSLATGNFNSNTLSSLVQSGATAGVASYLANTNGLPSPSGLSNLGSLASLASGLGRK